MRIPHLKTIGIRRPTINRATFPAEAEEEVADLEETFPMEAEEVADQEMILPTPEITETMTTMTRPVPQVTGGMT